MRRLGRLRPVEKTRSTSTRFIRHRRLLGLHRASRRRRRRLRLERRRGRLGFRRRRCRRLVRNLRHPRRQPRLPLLPLLGLLGQALPPVLLYDVLRRRRLRRGRRGFHHPGGVRHPHVRLRGLGPLAAATYTYASPAPRRRTRSIATLIQLSHRPDDAVRRADGIHDGVPPAPAAAAAAGSGSGAAPCAPADRAPCETRRRPS